MKTKTGQKTLNLLVVVLLLLGTVLSGITPAKAMDTAALSEAPNLQSTATKFAIITDYGTGTGASATANMVKTWSPEFIVTAGDNNQGTTCGTDCYANVVGNYYSEYLTSGTERLWPVIGNHDTYSPTASYLAYFDYIPNNINGSKLYYDFVQGPVHFFMLDSEVSDKETQKTWLEPRLKASTAAWQIVIFHQPAASAGIHGSNTNMQWDFAGWGADFVISGHNHIYERIEWNGIVYFNAGAGGNNARSDYNTGKLPSGVVTKAHFETPNANGATKVTASNTEITFEFYSTSDTVTPKDTYTQTREAPSIYAWEAYNDCVVTGTPANPTNTTGIVCYTNNASGELKNFNSGTLLGVNAVVNTSGSVNLQEGQYAGTTPDAGTDAHTLFNDKANIIGGVQMSTSSSTVTLTISGLDPDKTYTFATTANRGDSRTTYLGRITGFTLSGVDSAVNASSTGTTIDGLKTEFVTGYNTENGYIAKWENISPGTDGEFVVTFTNEGSETTAYGPAVFYLAEEIGDAETYTLTAVGDGYGSVELSPAGGEYFENQTVTLTPKPNPGFAFSHWTGDLTGNANPATIIMDGNKSVTANFAVSLCTTVNLVTVGDTRMRSSQATTNYGSETTVIMSPFTTSPQGGLFKWDLSSVPSDVIVDSASISFYVTDASAKQFSLYDLRRDWAESSATWNSTGTTNWTTAGAASTVNDRYNTNLWSGSFNTAGDVTLDLNTDGEGVIQDWIDGTKTNYGLTVQNYSGGSDQDYWEVASKENSSNYTKPTLNITYCTPSTDPTILTSVSALEPFTTQPGVPSAAQTYTVTGVNLEENLVITAPAGFALSTDGTTYSSTLSLIPTDGTVSQNIHVRLTGVTEDNYSGSITHISDGAAQKDVAVSGSVSSETCVTSRINLGSDDVEERMNTGSTNGDVDLDGDTNNKLLQMYRGYGGSTTDRNWWGFRFQNVAVPQGATIESANITFRANETSGSTASGMTLWGQAADNAATFTVAKNNVSSRPMTTASTNWSVPQWTSGSDYNTPNLAAVIQEIVDRPDWSANNAIAILGQTTVSQNRSAISYDSTNGATLAPILEVCYTVIDPRNITKEVDKDEAVNGDILTYTISDISYEGTDLLSEVTVTDEIPEETTYVTGSADPTATLNSGELTWTLGSNAAGVPGEETEGGGASEVTVLSASNTTGDTYQNTFTLNHTLGEGDNRLMVVGIS